MRNTLYSFILPVLLAVMPFLSGCDEAPDAPKTAKENYEQQLARICDEKGYSLQSTKLNEDNHVRYNGLLAGMTAESVVLTKDSNALLIRTFADTANRVNIDETIECENNDCQLSL